MPVAGKPVQFVKPLLGGGGGQGTPVPGQSVLEAGGHGPHALGFPGWKNPLRVWPLELSYG